MSHSCDLICKLCRKHFLKLKVNNLFNVLNKILSEIYIYISIYIKKLCILSLYKISIFKGCVTTICTTVYFIF